MFQLLNHLKTFPKGGVHPDDSKLSEKAAIQELPLPKMVTIPIGMHIGAPAEPVVERGDSVKVGQVIAKFKGFVSANIHSSVSGKVGKIEEVMDTTGYKHTAINIRVKEDEWEESIDRSPKLITQIPADPQEIIQKIQAGGVVGLGGAAFPSHVKLSVPAGKQADFLIINGVECEPYLTADHRIMLEYSTELLVGTQLLMKALGVKQAVVGVENNKHDAILLLEALVQAFPGIRIQALSVKYPQGGEKQLIKAVTDREVPSGKLPIDVGVVVQNVGTAYAVYQAVQKNRPLVDRIVTVTGPDIKTPSNFRVRIGTAVADLIEAVGGLPENTGKVISGGPMMGKAIQDLDVPIAKSTSGILVLPESEAKRAEVYNCVRCGKCVEVCPMGLEPYLIALHSERKEFDKTANMHTLDCIECGSCSFECPSNRPVLDYVRLAKKTIQKSK